MKEMDLSGLSGHLFRRAGANIGGANRGANGGANGGADGELMGS